MNGPARFGIGLVVGVLLAWGIVRAFDADLTPSDTESAPETSAVATATSALPWFEAGEVLMEATVLLPRGLSVEDDLAVLEYDLAGLSPTLENREDAEARGDVVVLPATWVLTTSDGASVDATTGPDDRRVRFELPVGAGVARIELVEWRVATPLGSRVELPITSGASGILRSGRVQIATVLEQANSTIVQVDLDQPSGDWEPRGIPVPLDQHWRVAGQEGGFQLIWEGQNAPEELVLEDTAVEWRPVQGSIPVYTAETG